jgi:hypothetical protein
VRIHCHGALEYVRPDNGTDFTLDELHEAVGGYIETVPLPGVSPELLLLIVNEEGQRLQLPVNEAATHLMGQAILGPALLCPRELIR